jgi:hypothetical protein
LLARAAQPPALGRSAARGSAAAIAELGVLANQATSPASAAQATAKTEPVRPCSSSREDSDRSRAAGS